jgi:hypothetical protein
LGERFRKITGSQCRRKRKMEAPGGLEPPIEILQTSALPLGDGAQLGCNDNKYGAGEGIRTLDLNLGKVALYH